MDRNLIDYLPCVLQEVREMQALIAAEQPEFEMLWAAVGNVFDDQFIIDATSSGVARWESILGIAAKPADSLGVRKTRVLDRLNMERSYSLIWLTEQLEILCGKDNYSILLMNDIYTLQVRVAQKAQCTLEEISELLDRSVPANMVIDLSLIYSEHEALKIYTHNHLAEYTHEKIRNEVGV